MSKTAKKDWRSDVYLPCEEKFPDDWPATVSRIKKRDHYRCKRCRSSKSLTVHHVIPRANAGSNDDSNLITLCTPCHNAVELGDDIDKIEYGSNHDYISDDWHAWVYGGARKPAN